MDAFKKFLFILFSLLITQKSVHNHNQGSYSTKITSFICKGSKFLSNLTCKLKPVRNGIGILEFQAQTVRPLDDIWFQMTLFYKFGTQYRQWLVSFDINFCEELRRPSKSTVIAKIVIDYWKRTIPQEFHSCPISGTLNAKFNSDNSTDNVFFTQFTRLPEGEYKLVKFAHTSRNETLWTYEMKFLVKSKNGINKTTMLTMG